MIFSVGKSLAGKEAFLTRNNGRYISRQDVIDTADLDPVSSIIKQRQIARPYAIHKG